MREYDRFEKGAANSNTSTAVLQRAAGRPERAHHHHHHPEAQPLRRTEQEAPDLRRACGGDLRRMPSQPVRRHARRDHARHSSATTCSASPARRSSPTTPARAATRSCAPPSRPLATSCTPTRSSMPSTTRTCCRSASTTSTRSRHRRASRTRRCRPSTPSGRCWRPERIAQVVGYIREHFDQKTKRNASYQHDGKRLAGFNSLFATASIDAAKRYYAEFAEQQKELPPAQRLKIGLIYSFAANEEEADGLLGEEEFETEGLDQGSRDFLDAAINDYNAMFGTSFDTSADKFQNYYKDLSQRLKKRELDLVIVVNMFLTGFDATTLNTLWVDKNLRAHGLIQAYSRTNRILNSVKTYGNIVSFRDLEQETNDALALFGNKDAKGIVLLKPYAEYYEEYQKKIEELVESSRSARPSSARPRRRRSSSFLARSCG